jgi:hypothetical protein
VGNGLLTWRLWVMLLMSMLGLLRLGLLSLPYPWLFVLSWPLLLLFRWLYGSLWLRRWVVGASSPKAG